MLDYFVMASFGLLLLGSWIRWGWVLARPLYRDDVDVGMCVGLGMSVLVIFGGILNLLKVVGPISLWFFLAAGLGSLVAYLWTNRASVSAIVRRAVDLPRKRSLVFALLTAIFLIACVRYFHVVSYDSYNSHDDFQGYFVFPQKMMQTGSLGDDPFSQRRLESALGGQSFLQSFVLLAGQPRNCALLDAGAGYIAAAIVLASSIYLLALPELASLLLLSSPSPCLSQP